MLDVGSEFDFALAILILRDLIPNCIFPLHSYKLISHVQKSRSTLISGKD